jgi:nitroimidazol reductase NimA-like FMN-containing flavoprotein (pyridoxamine 5'-phosphate oxidase superfamily)
MDAAEVREVLAAGTRTGKVATVSRKGRPHVAPLWFVLDGDDLVYITSATSAKGKHLRANLVRLHMRKVIAQADLAR